MAKFSPQANYFKISSLLQRLELYIFNTVFVLTLLFTFLGNSTLDKFLSIISLVILTVLNFFINDYQEKAETSRRIDFIDNSFGSKQSIHNSQGYYDTEEINKGLYKVIVNLFENCYFSYEISSAMKKKVLIKNSILLIVISIFSIYGFKNNNFALPVLQLFLSKYFIEDFITIKSYNDNIKLIFDNITTIFSDGLSEENINSNIINQGKIIGLLIQYEANISNYKVPLDSKIFDALNDELTERWDYIKNKYSIKGII